jgi:hypothetical protein
MALYWHQNHIYEVDRREKARVFIARENNDASCYEPASQGWDEEELLDETSMEEHEGGGPSCWNMKA